MQFVTFRADGSEHFGILRGTEIISLVGKLGNLKSLKCVISHWDDISGAVAEAYMGPATHQLSQVKLRPPVPNAGKVLCIGLNYADHAHETKAAIPTEPVVFNKFPSVLTAHGDPILLPPISSQVDFEAELVVVIGKGGKNIPEATARQHVFGYACGHDVSARDWQKGKPGGQWLLGKSFDTFGPMGPSVVTADEVGDPHNLRVRMLLNGNVMQDSNTSQFIFSVEKLIAYISAVVTLQPGDLLYTGTPPGVGVARTPPVFMKDGDVAEVEIEKIGKLVNPVRAG